MKHIGALLARHLATIIAALGIVWGGFVFIAQPRAEQFIRDTVGREQFATAKELEQQTRALRDLSANLAKQSDVVEEQSRITTSLQTDIEAIKALQLETLRVLLRSERDN